MRLVLDNLKIELENQQEIRDFWNVVSFALDLQAQRDEENKPCMTESEFKLAKKLQEITRNSWDW